MGGGNTVNLTAVASERVRVPGCDRPRTAAPPAILLCDPATVAVAYADRRHQNSFLHFVGWSRAGVRWI